MAIIDDGLLVQDRRVLAGFSAKFETNQISAIKRAIFSDPVHRIEVRQRIVQLTPTTLLVLGTSEKMIRTICDALELGTNVEWLPIEAFASANDMALASNLRKRGMHAIPIVQSQLAEAPLPQYIRRLRHRFLAHKYEVSLPIRQDLTVVSPLFNEGAVYIHPRVVRDSIIQLMEENRHPFHLRRFSYNPDVSHVLHLHVQAEWHEKLQQHAHQLIADIHRYLQDYLGFPHMFIALRIDSISVPTRQRQEHHRTSPITFRRRPSSNQ